MTPQALQGAAVSGAGNALDRLANFFMDMAEEMFPVIEIDAGRGDVAREGLKPEERVKFDQPVGSSRDEAEILEPELLDIDD